MIDFVVVATIIAAIREQPEHSVAEVVLFVTYVVVAIAAIVTAATMCGMKRSDTSSITLAATAPCIYLMLLPFGVLVKT